MSARVVCAFLVAVLAASACQSVLSVRYEYEEDVYLELDGSATVYVNASVPALVALRGAPLDADSRARLDRNDVRAFFASAVADVANVTTSRRENRRYVHVRLEVPDIRRLGEAPAFAWSRYAFEVGESVAVYTQEVGASAAGAPADDGWTGRELVAVRLHLPSRVTWHNAPSREIERGNIIRWEQPLAARAAGEPLEVEAHMETQSILVQTLTLFGAMIVLALAALGAAVWFVARRGKS